MQKNIKLFFGFKGSVCDLWHGIKFHKSYRVIYDTNVPNDILIGCAQQEKCPAYWLLVLAKVLTFLVHALGSISTVAPVGLGFGLVFVFFFHKFSQKLVTQV